MNGGALIASTLARLGVTDIFALHGGHLDALLVACPDEGIRLIDCRHEATCGHAAEGYARSTGGRIGVALVTAGPGFANALTPMTSAWLDAMPVLFIAGSPPLREIETNPLQGGFDQLAMATPVCKWVHRITHTERIPDLFDKAIRIALSGRPGPVFIEVPIDVMFAPVESIMIPVERAPESNFRPAPPPAATEQAIDLLVAAERPVILAGGGTILSPSSEPLGQFAEITGIPVASNNKAHGVLPFDHPQYIGGTGAIGAATVAGAGPDVVLMLGARGHVHRRTRWWRHSAYGQGHPGGSGRW